MDAATDTIEGRFRGPSQEAAQEVYDMIVDAKANPEKYGRAPPAGDAGADGEAPKKKRRRVKKTKDEL